MKNVRMVEFTSHSDNYGKLVPIEAGSSIPFDVKRVYYIYEVEENVRRGFHSHKKLEQVLICVHGKVKILVKTPHEEEVVELDDPKKGLYIGHMIWREMFDFSDGAVLLVLASEHYTEDDYIRKYEDYEAEAENYNFN
ncbi:MAG: WxcM-like domain-containing protein [Lachnospiraceae bacterium]|nr:WxcM-like domain-containing protein [Lachnospiraceae bacterium]